jgi:transcriptional antiterminator NusG
MIIEKNNDVLVDEKFKWYALYCASNQEKSTKINLERNLRVSGLDKCVSKIEVPMDKVLIDYKGKKVQREKVVLPCYIFINMDISNGEILPLVRGTKGVLGFINPSDGKSRLTPEPLKNSQVEKFFKVSVPEENTSGVKFNIGDRVRIIEGAFATFEGNIEAVDSSKKIVKVCVKIFSRETLLEVDFEHVDKNLIVR